MYFWKCWRDTRGVFFVFFGAMIAVAGINRCITADWFGWSSALFATNHGQAALTADLILRSFTPLIPLAGFVIGALGVGVEFQKRTLPFLLTRPRSRRSFLWSSWLAGALEVSFLAILAVWFYAARVRIGDDTPRISWLGGLRAVMALVIIALVIYSLTFCLTVLSKKEQRGTTAAVAVVFSYSAIVTWARVLYGVRLPVFWELYLGVFDPKYQLSIPLVMGWLCVAFALVLASQLYFQRSEDIA